MRSVEGTSVGRRRTWDLGGETEVVDQRVVGRARERGVQCGRFDKDEDTMNGKKTSDDMYEGFEHSSDLEQP
jgi:hypothetical protein